MHISLVGLASKRLVEVIPTLAIVESYENIVFNIDFLSLFNAKFPTTATNHTNSLINILLTQTQFHTWSFYAIKTKIFCSNFNFCGVKKITCLTRTLK